MTMTTRGAAEMTAAMTILGTIGWFVVTSGEPAVSVVFWRCAFGAATLLVVCAALGLLRGRLTPRVLAIAASGGVAIVINWLLLFASYPRASISVATAVYNTQPFMLVGLGVLFLRERPGATKLLWLGLAFAGMLLIVQAKPSLPVSGQDYLTGVLLALGAAFFYALAALAAKKLDGTPPHLVALIQVSVGVVLLAPLNNFASLPADPRTWILLAAIGVIHTGLMYILLYGAIQKLPTHLIGSLSFIYPIAAIFVDALAFGHRLQATQIIGAAAILVSVAGMNFGWFATRPQGRAALAAESK